MSILATDLTEIDSYTVVAACYDLTKSWLMTIVLRNVKSWYVELICNVSVIF